MRLARLTAVVAVIGALMGMSSWALAADSGSGDADADAAKKAQQERAECLTCHSAQGLQNPPRQGMDLAKLGELLVSNDRLQKSVHADFSCEDCHGAVVATYPHGADARAQVKSCPECHKPMARRIVPEFKDSVHVVAHLPNFTCSSCHDPHTWQKVSSLGSARLTVRQDNAMCRSCHENDARFAQFTPVTRHDLADSHKWLPNPDLHWTAVRCIDCHTAAKDDGGVSHVILPGTKAERRCVECHSANSSLRSRLYRSKVEEAQVNTIGFLNAYILNEAYVLGVTRNQWLDWASVAILALLVAGLGGHGLLRFASNMLRKGRK